METHFFVRCRSKDNIKSSFRETKNVLPDLTFLQKTGYVKNRHNGESDRLISDIIEIAKIKKKLKGFLVTMEIEKAFFLDHNFLIFFLEKYGFGKKFILWVMFLLGDQESCVINGGITT